MRLIARSSEEAGLGQRRQRARRVRWPGVGPMRHDCADPVQDFVAEFTPAAAFLLGETRSRIMGEYKPYLHSTRPCELAWSSSALQAFDQAGSSA